MCQPLPEDRLLCVCRAAHTRSGLVHEESKACVGPGELGEEGCVHRRPVSVCHWCAQVSVWHCVHRRSVCDCV